MTSPSLEADIRGDDARDRVEFAWRDAERDLQSLVVEWKVMASNINTLKKMVNGYRVVSQDVSEIMREVTIVIL
jgi:hypothetical protein